MRTTGELDQQRQRPDGRADSWGRVVGRLGLAAAAGLSLSLAFSLGVAVVGGVRSADAAAPRVVAGVSGAATYGGAPADDATAIADGDGGSNAAASFALATGVRAELLALWDSSVVANEERVACIGGARGRDGVVRITRVYTLPVVSADSANAGAGPSLSTCRPPEWFGTVHTHIITDPLGEPYTQFSSPDRDVIARWQRAWRADGVFCLLYSDADAHCELGGGQAAANVTYASDGGAAVPAGATSSIFATTAPR